MGRFVDLILPSTGWNSELYYFVCTLHRALQFAPNNPDCDPYKAVCSSYTSVTKSNIDPLVPTARSITYSRGNRPQDRWTILSVRGTETTQSWVGNLTGWAQGTEDRVRGKVHGYFRDAARQLWLQFEDTFRSDVGNGRCLFTGHSLGGALAHLMAWFLAVEKPGQSALLVTLGAPRLGNPLFADPLQPQPVPVVRLENTHDFIPSSPPPIVAYAADTAWGAPWPVFNQYRHAGMGYILSDTAGIRQEDDWVDGTIARTLENSGTPAVFDRFLPHSNTEYCRRIRNTMVRQPRVDANGNPDTVIDVEYLDIVNQRISVITGESFSPSFVS